MYAGHSFEPLERGSFFALKKYRFVTISRTKIDRECSIWIPLMAALGRPPKHKAPDQMQRLVDLYFIACKSNRIKEASGGEVDGLPDNLSKEDIKIINNIDDSHPTVTGLASALNLTRQGLIEYDEKEEFSDTVKKAKARVEAYVEQRLYYPNATGCIFNLKNNFGWKDQVDHSLFGKDGGAIETKDVSAYEVARRVAFLLTMGADEASTEH